VKQRVKNSIGIWGFGPAVTRFMTEGYHPEAAGEDVVTRAARAAEGLDDLIDGFELHYPGEINEANLPALQRALGNKDVYGVAGGLHADPRFALGGFTNPDPALRAQAVAIIKAAIDLAAGIGAKLLLWPGGEGYNYPFQVDYVTVWEQMIAAVQEIVEHANARRVPVLLEHKNSEPAMKILMRDIGMTMFIISSVKERRTDVANVKINMDWMHLIMNGEPLAEYAALLSHRGLLGHNHANAGWGVFDDDNMVGTSYFMQTLALAVELQDAGYGSKGERIGYDLYPYTEDPVAAARRSILQWEFIDQLAAKIDRTALIETRARKDAVACYEVVFAALGLDKKTVQEIERSHRA
jgi:xylose isomerase